MCGNSGLRSKVGLLCYFEFVNWKSLNLLTIKFHSKILYETVFFFKLMFESVYLNEGSVVFYKLL